jgi:hypothetical protein
MSANLCLKSVGSFHMERVAEGMLVATVCLYVDFGPGLAKESCVKGAVCHI